LYGAREATHCGDDTVYIVVYGEMFDYVETEHRQLLGQPGRVGIRELPTG
jgi:hypothetical protein